MKSLQSLFCLLVMGVCGLVAGAQTMPPPRASDARQKQEDATIRIATELVQLSVIVTDKAGHPVRHLQPADFELWQDGKLQPLTHFSLGTATQPARWLTAEPKRNEAAANPPTTRATGRHIVLVIDDFHLAPDSLARARQALLKFVDQQFSYVDKIALVTVSGQLWPYQQFTNKREILKRAIERLAAAERRTSPMSGDVPRLSAYQAELIQNRDPDALALAVNEIRRQAPDTPPDVAAAMAQAKAQQLVAENAFHAKTSLTTLEEVLRSLRVLPGHKSVVFLSDGFLLGGSQQSGAYDLRQVTDAATRGGMMIYTLDTRGLVAAGGADVSQASFGIEQPPGARTRIEADAVEVMKNPLHTLARDTGGLPVFNANDLNLGLRHILADAETYYLLAFEPQEATRDGRFRKLEVRVKDHPDYTVRTSRGYFAPHDKAAETPKKSGGLKAGLTRNTFSSLVPARDIPVEMAVDFVDSGHGDGFATITMHLDVSSVKFEKLNERHHATLLVMGAIYDEDGKPMDRFARKLALTLKSATYERMLKSGFVFDSLVKLKPGFYQVRVTATQEASNQHGSVSEWVEIGDLSKKELRLSSLFLATEREKLFTGLQPTEPSEKKPDEQAAPMPAQVSRRFTRGSSFDYTLFAYNPKADAQGAFDLVVQTQLFSGTKVVLSSPLATLRKTAEQKDAPFVPHVARLSLENFAPGNYELRVLVIDRIAQTNATRSLYFVVEP